MNLLLELKRRNVVRMAGLYLVGAWLIVQVAETLLPIFRAPDWVLATLVVLIALGFVPALVFSWVFEMTPEGLKRDSHVPIEQSIAPQTARRMDRIIVALLLLALAFYAFDRLVLVPGRDAARVADAPRDADARSPIRVEGGGAAATAAAPAKSIAVLPFVNMSPDKDNEYFSDGVSEENRSVDFDASKAAVREYAARATEIDPRSRVAEPPAARGAPIAAFRRARAPRGLGRALGRVRSAGSLREGTQRRLRL